MASWVSEPNIQANLQDPLRREIAPTPTSAADNSALADHAPVALVGISKSGIVHIANRSCKSVIGIPSSVLQGSCLFDLIDGDSAAKLKKALHGVCERNQKLEISVKFIEGPSGNTYFTVRIAHCDNSDSSKTEFVLSFSDNSRYQQIVEQFRSAKVYLEAMVNKDALTGLPNRVHFVDALRTAMFNARKTQRKIALMYFDIDGFKLINDQHGHRIGDMLLCELANRLRLRIRDVSRLARLGGDEFTLILDYNDCESSLHKEADKVLSAISAITEIESRQISISASIGIGVYPGYAKTPEELIHYSDAAMYRAKNAGGNRAITFCQRHYEKIKRTSDLSQDLKQAIELDQMCLVYQPIVDSQSGLVDSLEVLVRWAHPRYGEISPEEFIPLAEKNNLIIPVTYWIVRTAMCEMKTLLNSNKLAKLSINLSARLLSDVTFPEKLLDEMRRCNVEPNKIELEITETGVIENLDSVVCLAEKLNCVGCSLSVDDFGTGYSSLARLIKLPISRIKLDKYFISEISDSKAARVIVEAIICIAGELGLGVVAEGVENESQVQLLKKLGCGYLQGFEVAEPQPVKKVTSSVQQTFFRTETNIAC